LFSILGYVSTIEQLSGIYVAIDNQGSIFGHNEKQIVRIDGLAVKPTLENKSITKASQTTVSI
jgi:hypothetical protein